MPLFFWFCLKDAHRKISTAPLCCSLSCDSQQQPCLLCRVFYLCVVFDAQRCTRAFKYRLQTLKQQLLAPLSSRKNRKAFFCCFPLEAQAHIFLCTAGAECLAGNTPVHASNKTPSPSSLSLLKHNASFWDAPHTAAYSS